MLHFGSGIGTALTLSCAIFCCSPPVGIPGGPSDPTAVEHDPGRSNTAAPKTRAARDRPFKTSANTPHSRQRAQLAPRPDATRSTPGDAEASHIASASDVPGAHAQASVFESGATGNSTGSESSLRGDVERIAPLTFTVNVEADQASVDTGSPEPQHARGDDVLTSAGTFGDLSRFLQVLPGVVASSDISNQIFVRGGHPLENLFVVDGIEVPNINHLANANTTGGFGPMIDAAVIQSLDFYAGAYAAKYPERLSSVTEFRTLDFTSGVSNGELDLGIQGVGGYLQQPVRGGTVLVSAHHGLVNLVSDDVGINGVPSYTNELLRYRGKRASEDVLTLEHIGGIDSISITPCASDYKETSTINSSYDGWRETTGLEWQHVFSAQAFGTLSISDSEQVEHISEEDQALDPLKIPKVIKSCPLPKGWLQSTPVYSEDSNNAFSTAKYGVEYGRSAFALSAGAAIWMQRPHFSVDQPLGAFSPYQGNMVRADSTSFNAALEVAESSTYAQMVFRPTRALTLSAGGREQTFAFHHHSTLTPRLSVGYKMGEHATAHIAYASYAQLPPYAYLLAYPVNQTMAPMRSTHAIVGVDVNSVPGSQIRVEAYMKDYRAVPASTEYPGVTLHTMVDMIGEQIVWLPMTTAGHGEATGIELSDETRVGSRLQTRGSIAYARARFAGRDGILHPSSFDLPWIVNGLALATLPRNTRVSLRYAFASGRPYTPFDMSASLKQNRPIYDLAQINVPRAPCYSRLDVQVIKRMPFHRLNLDVYLGVDNVLNHENLLSYAWMPRYRPTDPNRNPVGALWQTPIFPNFGLRLRTR